MPITSAPACIRATVPVAVVLLIATAAYAQVPVSSEAHLEIWSIQHSAHSPCSGSSYNRGPTEDPFFVVSGGPQLPEGDCLDLTWTVACTDGAMLYICQLAGVPEWYQWGRYVDARCDLTCRLEVTTPLLLTATRSADSGPVAMTGHHDVLLTPPGGDEFSIFGADSTAAVATHLLEPGTWTVAIDAAAILADRNLMEYSALVRASWNATVEVDERSWGGIKALYR